MSAATTDTSARTTTTGGWMDKMVEELLAKGWKVAGLDQRQLPKLSDPLGKADLATGDFVTRNERGRDVTRFEPRQTVDVPLKTRDGNVEVFKQVVGPPIQFDYRVEEAYAIQRQREEYAARQAEEARAREEKAAAAKAAPNGGGGPKIVSSTTNRK